MSDDTHDAPPPPRALDIRISSGTEVGFLVWEAGQVVAALTSRVEVADWLEHRLGSIPGEREREARDLASTQAAFGNVERMPNVAQSPPAVPSRSRGYFKR